MLRIPGFGPKRAKAVYDKLKVDSIEKLEAACKAGKVAQLDGFGEKSQQKILEGIALVRQFGSRHHYDTGVRRRAADPRSVAGAQRRHPLQHRRQPAPLPRNHRRHGFSRQRQTEGCARPSSKISSDARHHQRQRQGRDESQRRAQGRHPGGPARGHRRAISVRAELFHREARSTTSPCARAR